MALSVTRIAGLDLTLSSAPGGEVRASCSSRSADCPLSLDRRGDTDFSEKDQRGSSAPGAPRGLRLQQWREGSSGRHRRPARVRCCRGYGCGSVATFKRGLWFLKSFISAFLRSVAHLRPRGSQDLGGFLGSCVEMKSCRVVVDGGPGGAPGPARAWLGFQETGLRCQLRRSICKPDVLWLSVPP